MALIEVSKVLLIEDSAGMLKQFNKHLQVHTTKMSLVNPSINEGVIIRGVKL